MVLWVVISNDCKRAAADMEVRHPGLTLEWGDDYSAGTEDVLYKGNYLTVLFSQAYFSEGVVAHEAIHIKNLVMAHAGIHHDFKNDEPEAYMTGQIVTEIYKVWREYKKK